MSDASYNNLPAIIIALARELDQAADDSAAIVEREIKRSMSDEKHGLVYRGVAITKQYKIGGRAYKKWRGSGAKATFSGGRATIVTGYKAHRASAPGEAPAIDTGALVNDFTISVHKPFVRKISTSQEQAGALEFGRLDGRMKARPFMRPAAAKKQAAVKKRFRDALGKAQEAR